MKWNPMVPELLVSDFPRSRAFYVEIIGFTVSFERTDPLFAHLDLGGAQLMLEEDHDDAWRVDVIENPRGRGMNLQIDVPHVFDVDRRLASEGVPLFLR